MSNCRDNVCVCGGGPVTCPVQRERKRLADLRLACLSCWRQGQGYPLCRVCQARMAAVEKLEVIPPALLVS